MINFEKWKKNLKPEDMFFPDIIADQEKPKLDCSFNCPARDTCSVVSSAKRLRNMEEKLTNNGEGEGIRDWQTYEDDRDKHYDLIGHCRLFFNAWAHDEVMDAKDDFVKEAHDGVNPLTNFEKWKSDLWIDDLFFFDPIQGFKHPQLDCFSNCPARHKCPYTNKLKEYDKYRSLRYLSEEQQHDLRRLAKQCKKWFTEWANATTDEDENIW